MNDDRMDERDMSVGDITDAYERAIEGVTLRTVQSVLYVMAAVTIIICIASLIGCVPVGMGAKAPSGVDVPLCVIPDGMLPLTRDVCEGGKVALQGRACVHCPANQGCFDQVDAVYCVAGGCGDPRCHEEKGIDP